jgi:ketosteroid isomerase-like protein
MSNIQLPLIFMAGAAVAAMTACTAPVPAQHSDQEERTVMAITQEVCEAFRAGDVPAVEKLLAPRFTLVQPDAHVQSRAEVIAEVRARDPKYEVFRNHSMTAQVYGDAAIVQGITTVKGTSGGKPFQADVRFTDTLVREQGQWRLVVSHVTGMPAR